VNVARGHRGVRSTPCCWWPQSGKLPPVRRNPDRSARSALVLRLASCVVRWVAGRRWGKPHPTRPLTVVSRVLQRIWLCFSAERDRPEKHGQTSRARPKLLRHGGPKENSIRQPRIRRSQGLCP